MLGRYNNIIKEKAGENVNSIEYLHIMSLVIIFAVIEVNHKAKTLHFYDDTSDTFFEQCYLVFISTFAKVTKLFMRAFIDRKK